MPPVGPEAALDDAVPLRDRGKRCQIVHHALSTFPADISSIDGSRRKEVVDVLPRNDPYGELGDERRAGLLVAEWAPRLGANLVDLHRRISFVVLRVCRIGANWLTRSAMPVMTPGMRVAALF